MYDSYVFCTSVAGLVLCASHSRPDLAIACAVSVAYRAARLARPRAKLRYTPLFYADVLAATLACVLLMPRTELTGLAALLAVASWHSWSCGDVAASKAMHATAHACVVIVLFALPKKKTPEIS